MTLDFGDTKPMCKAFGLRLVKGVKNGPSPKWLQDRLTAIGLRPINILVDITNYMTFDQGRPLHVFDADKVHGNLVVRRGKAGEKIDGLNGKSYDIDDTVCVISDDNGVESLGGILGGEPSGCTEDTVNVLIESALWDEDGIAATGRKLGVNTDARYRFERGVDPNYMMPGLEAATRMVLDLCGGEPSEAIQAGDVPDSSNIIEFPLFGDQAPGRRRGYAGGSQCDLKSLGFWISGSGDTVKVAAPSWRPDIEGKADLVEEVVRIIGLDRVPFTPLPPTGTVGQKVLTTGQIRRSKARRALAARGFNEAVTWSFIAKGPGRAVRRRQCRAGAGQSDFQRNVRHAPEPAAGSSGRRPAQRRPRLWRCRPVRGRPGV